MLLLCTPRILEDQLNLPRIINRFGGIVIHAFNMVFLLINDIKRMC